MGGSLVPSPPHSARSRRLLPAAWLAARERAWAGDLLALCGGCVLPLAFAPFGLHPLAVLAPALLFAAWLGASPRRALWRGWLFGAGMYGLGVSWVHESFQFSAVGAPLSLVLTAGLLALLALYPALQGYLSVRLLRGSDGLRVLWLWPAAWVLVEWFRGWFLTGFTWLQLGYSQVDGPLAGLLPVVGVYGVGWVVALSAGLVVWVVGALAAQRARPEPATQPLMQGARRRARPRFELPWLGVLVAALLWGGGASLRGIGWTTPVADALEVALLQGNISQDVKWRPEQRGPTLERYASLTRGHWSADLVVWPETALPGFYRDFQAFLGELAAEASARGTDLLLGVPVRDPRSRRYFNSIVALGSQPGVYHKRHLVPFGEYLPLESVLGGVVDVLQIPMSDFSAGPPRQAPLEVAGQPVAPSVCYEMAFGREIMDMLPEATLLVNVSNDAWFGDSIAPHQHLEIARVRALETGRYVVRATNTGISAIIRPDGSVQARGPQFEKAVVTGRVVPMSGSTPYDGYRESGVAGALGAILLAGLGVGLTRRRRG